MSMPYVAIVGGQSLVGREIRSLLSQQHFPAHVRLIGADEEEVGAVTEQDGEPVVVSSLDQDNLTGARVVFLAGSPEAGRKAYDCFSRVTPTPAAVDLTGGLEDLPNARLRAPFVEQLLCGAQLQRGGPSLTLLGGSDFRAGQRARPARHRGTAAADHQPVVV